MLVLVLRFGWQAAEIGKAYFPGSMQLIRAKVEEVKAALDADATGYPPNLGVRRLRRIHTHGGPFMIPFIPHSRILAGVLLASLSILNPILYAAVPLGSVFTYQGQLTDHGAAANGKYDLRFTLYDAVSSGAQVGPVLTTNEVTVSEGQFTVMLDFGAGIFSGEACWLEIAVRTNSSIPFIPLSPRQPLTPAPYALYAISAGLAVQATTSLGVANSGVTSGGIADGTITADDVSRNTFWQARGNTGTTPGMHFLGTTDNRPLEFKVNGLRAFLLEAGTSPNVIGGYQLNDVTGGVIGATVSGGGESGSANRVSDNLGTVGGGTDNVAGNDNGNAFDAHSATVGGGRGNRASGLSTTVGGGGGNTASGSNATVGGGATNVAFGARSTIAGGEGNRAGGAGAAIAGGADNETGGLNAAIGGGAGNLVTADYSNVGGGEGNIIQDSVDHSTIGGGEGNIIQDSVDHSTIGGGKNNVIRIAANVLTFGTSYATIGGGENNIADGSYSTVPGGDANVADGFYSFAAGRRAKAHGDGSFVWGDSCNSDVHAWGLNQFVLRATGGYWLFSAVDGSGNPTAGATLAAGSGTWGSWSDRNAKTNYAAVDTRAVLEKVAALPMATWNYTTQDPSIRHMGPAAQDFHAAFGVGDSDKTITTIDADGVALAAIQGLNQRVEEWSREQGARNGELEARSQKLETENAELKRELSELKHLVGELSSKLNGGAQ